MKRIWLGIILVLLLPSSAQAGWRSERATAIAEIVWHDPCDEKPLELRWEPMGVDGRVAFVRDSETAAFGRCVIHMNSEGRKAPASVERDDWSWGRVCSTLIHEMGHVAGYRNPHRQFGEGSEHSDDPRSVMHESVPYDRRCDLRGRPYLEKHGRF